MRMAKDLNITRYCGECGSTNVDSQTWVNPNTQQISGICGDFWDSSNNWCNCCEQHVPLYTLKELWMQFGDMTVNSDDEIERPFLNFPAGTNRFEVLKWFDERCPNGVTQDLMY